MRFMQRRRVRRILRSIRRGQIFSVRFVKRTNGDDRRMTCRTGVTRYLVGAGPKYDFAKKGLVPVFDLGKKEYRCFPVDSIREIRAKGKVYRPLRNTQA